MRKLAIVIASLMGIVSIPSLATDDYGKIKKLYADHDGNIAVQLVGGFPNSNAANECPSNNGWAGHLNPDPLLKSALLAAKASGVNVTLSISGCANNWLKVNAVYIHEQ